MTETDAVDAGGFVDIRAGLEARTVNGAATVVDVASGETLLSVPVTKNQYGGFDLSPDGRYAVLSIEDMMSMGEGKGTVEVYDVSTGDHVAMPSDNYGWSVDSELFSVSEDELTTCDPATGRCTSAPHGITMPPKTAPQETCDEFEGRKSCYTIPGETWEGTIRLGNRIFES